MTIVNRRIFNTLRGKNQEAVNLAREAASGLELQYRIYSSSYGRFDQVVLEIEFENMAHMEQFWDAFMAGAETSDFLATWDAATEPGGLNEVWVLEGHS